MSLLNRLLLISFIESFACILVEQGVYFFCHDRLAFPDQLNLWLAVAFGVAYVVGALSSHRLSIRLTEKHLLLLAIGGQVLAHATLAIHPSSAIVFIFSTAIGLFNGAKWPLIESYVSAGQTPSQTARTVGRFNIAWAIAVPPALAVVGPLIAWTWPSRFVIELPRVLHWTGATQFRFAQGFALFALAGLMNLASLWLIRPLDDRPVHLPEDHPDRPDAAATVRLRSMLAFSRWIMFASYATLFVLAALLPGILENSFGFSAKQASPLSSIVHLLRLGAFVALACTARWHHRWGPLVIGTIGLPFGFVLILFKSSLLAVVAGEIIFGAMAGLIYYAALYYAMVVKNASVNAGGAHEGLIGLGFAIGPGAALAGSTLAPLLGSEALGVMAGVGPMFLACVAGAVIWAVRIWRSPAAPSS